MITVSYVRQGESLGLGHAVLMAQATSWATSPSR